jgi:ubiquinone/menaquinone biosynthesis C-methylase UbiE
VSTFVLMRLLESAPYRYDLGIKLLTLSRLDRAYDRLVARIEAGGRVLDIGCGTGALALRAARRGATVKGIDVNPEMLEIAAGKARGEGLAERVELAETGVAELDGEKAARYDAVTSGLCLSELSEDEIAYTLGQVERLLVPGGLFLVADETRPRGLLRRVLRALLRAPLVVITWLVTQQTTHAVADLPGRLVEAGLVVENVRASALGGFVEIVARRPDRAGS